MSNSNYKRLGNYIRLVDERNKELKVKTLLGLTINKVFIPSVANTVGTNMANYKIIRKNQFACSLMQVRRDKKIPVALLKDFDEAIISQAYPVFEIIDTDKLLPEYLMMWFSRKEFDREACFYAVGGVRGSLEWEDFCEMSLPVPNIERQKEIVAEYNTIVNRIKLNKELNKKLKETAQAIYKRWFVEFEFLCLPENYKFSGADKPDDFNSVMTYKRVGGLPLSDGDSWFVYVILCQDGSFYKGITKDLYRRFYEHYTGQGSDWTKVHKPEKVIHWERFNTKEEAAKREKELKTGYGRTWLKREYDKVKGGLPAPKTKLRMAGKMVWNEELGKEIPEGWEVICIKDFSIEMKSGGTPNRSINEYWNSDDIPWLKTGEVENNIILETKEYISNLGFKNSSAKMYPVNTVIMALYGATAGQIAYLKMETTANQACCGMICNSEMESTYLYYFLLLNQNEIANMAFGGAQPNLSKNLIEELRILSPKKEVLKKHPFVRIIKYKENIAREIISLKKLKDLLLSKMTKI